MKEIIKKITSRERAGVKNIILLSLLIVALGVVGLISKMTKGKVVKDGFGIMKINYAQADFVEGVGEGVESVESTVESSIESESECSCDMSA